MVMTTKINSVNRPGYDWSNEMAEFERIGRAVTRVERRRKSHAGGEPSSKRSRSSGGSNGAGGGGGGGGGGAAAAASDASVSAEQQQHLLAAGTPPPLLSRRTPVHLGLWKQTLPNTKAKHQTLSDSVENYIEQTVVDDDTETIDPEPFLANLRSWLSPSVHLPTAYLRDVLVSVLGASE